MTYIFDAIAMDCWAAKQSLQNLEVEEWRGELEAVAARIEVFGKLQLSVYLSVVLSS